jgi:outer membrane protein assembly factor BamB
MARGLVCTSCSAPLPEPDGGDFLRCAHCGRVHDLRGAVPEPEDEVVHASGGAGCVAGGAVIGAVAVSGLGVLVAGWLVATPVMDADSSPLGGLSEVVQQAVQAASPQRALWDDVGGSALVLTAPSERYVGRIRVFPEDTLFLAAFGPDTKELWRTEPLGTYSEGYNATYFAEVGGRVALTDFHGEVRVLDAADGREVGRAKLTDKARAICAVDGRIRVDQVDERAVWVDVTTAAVSEAPRRPECGWNRRAAPSPFDLDRLPKLAGFKADRAWPLADGVVAVGRKSPGTPTPRAVRWGGGAVRWDQWVPAVDPATVRDHGGAADADARGVAVAYGVGTEDWHVTLLDVETGARLWDVTLRRIFAVDNADELKLTPTSVLVVRTSSMDVLDRADGHLIGHIGTDTYDDALR